MHESELLSALSRMMDEKVEAMGQSLSRMMDEKVEALEQSLSRKMDEKIQPIQTEINSINGRLDKMEFSIKQLEHRATQREINLENNINKNIQFLLEGHSILARDIKEMKKDTSRIEKIETELFATREITKENVQSIKKLQTKRKI